MAVTAKATLRLDNLLEVLKGLKKAIIFMAIFMVIIYCRETLENKISKGERCVGQVQEEKLVGTPFQWSLILSSFQHIV